MGFRTIAMEYAKLSSAHFIFLTAVIPITGAIAMGEKNLFLLTVIFIIGITAHIVGFAFNHYNDIKVDSLINEKLNRPLPSGKISKKNALIYIISMFLIGFFLTLYFFGIWLVLIYIFGIILASIYDIYSKKICGMDLILASSVSVGVFFGSATVSFVFSNIVIILWILAFFQTLNLNLVAGGIKDADHDSMIGSRHISTVLGVRVKNDTFFIPSSFKIISYMIGLIYSLFVLIPVILGIIKLNILLITALFVINIIFFIVTYKMINLKNFERQKIRKYIVLQFTFNWFNIPILLMSDSPWAGLMVFYPIIGLIASNIIIYRTIVTPQVM